MNTDTSTECSAHRRSTLAAIGALVISLSLSAAGLTHAQDRTEAPASIFKPLRVGQKGNVEERGGLVEIHLLMEGGTGTYTIIELGRMHLLLEDIVGVSRRWIPVTAIRAVVWTRIPGTIP